MITPFSATLVLAPRLTVVVSVESVTVVTAGAGLAARFSKFPPETPVMVVLIGAAPL